MREPLNQPDRDRYDRPNQPWICGRAAEGDPCAFGPGTRGVCPALAECKPVEIEGQWRCDRPATRGGLCDQGPTADGKCCRAQHCKPVRNLRSLRGAIVRSCMLFAAGVLLMMLGSSWRSVWLAPGPLTSHHAQVLQGAAWNQRCSSCHAAADRAPGTWLTALVGGQLGPTQTSKCLACHQKTIDVTVATMAHTVPANVLAGLHPAGSISESGDMSSLACSVCHQEHHGMAHDIAAMDNTRCQSCHTRQFGSFATDHPDFGTWPYQRRTPIAFSHASHFGKHFKEKGHEPTCQQCHVEDQTRNVQLTLGYQAACAECHDADIVASTTGGVTLLAMPSLDLDALSSAGFEVRNWPERATGDFDGKLPAIMKLLLAQDESAREAVEVLGADFDFFDVDPDDVAHVTAAADLARAIDRLVESMTRGELEGAKAIAPGLTGEVLERARGSWMASAGETQLPTPQPGTWFADDVSLSIRYQPTGHADPVLKAWIDAILAEPDGDLRDALLADFTGPGAPGRCTTCHSIERQGVAFAINWHTHDRREDPRGFTRFSHAPHLLPVELRDCTACHAIDLAADTTSSYSGKNPVSFVSDFRPVSKQSCAACHNKAAVGENCTQCHNYHVEQW